jgi:hypothetical protein
VRSPAGREQNHHDGEVPDPPHGQTQSPSPTNGPYVRFATRGGVHVCDGLTPVEQDRDQSDAVSDPGCVVSDATLACDHSGHD